MVFWKVHIIRKKNPYWQIPALEKFKLTTFCFTKEELHQGYFIYNFP